MCKYNNFSDGAFCNFAQNNYLTMEKELRFKKEWFDVLNRCDSALRTDVVEAVFQYFFCGIVPTFDDDARTIAFGFIRADIDATRRRRNLRLARLAKAENLNSGAGQSDSEELKDAGLKSRPEAFADEKPEPISRDDEERVYGLVRTWNQVMTPLGCKTIPTLTPCSHELYRPVLRALKRKPFREIFETIMHLPDVQPRPKFAEFFNSI